MIEDRGQLTDVRCRMSEVGGQRAGVGFQDSRSRILDGCLIGWKLIDCLSYPESWVLDLVSEYNRQTLRQAQGRRANGQTG